MELQLELPGDWPAREYARAPVEAPDADDLESVLTWLQQVEINAYVQTAPPDHIAVGMHDPCGGPDIQHAFHRVDGAWPRGAIARWLIHTAKLYYPRGGFI